jgi:serine/threonine protein kinase
MVGPYRMLTRLGEGGMGVVHLGQAADGRRLAVKVLRPHVVGDDEARDRLAREVNSLSRVKSPRVAEIIDADPYGPIPYVATRYVPGLALSEHVKQEGAITGADLTWFARALAEALDAVHAAGVLHRDVKPSNVLMEGRTPILIDFGLAKVADDVRLTRTGWLLGTPGYIAPETLHGEDPTTAADVHGWAATVAYAGTGRAPFGRGPSMAIMDRVRRGQHDLGGLDPRLLPLVSRGLDPDPFRRPRMAEVLHALGAVPTTPRAPMDDVPPTQPHDLASLLWATQRNDAEPATRAFEEPPTRGYDEDPTAYDEPPPNRQPFQTPPPADWSAEPPADPYGADWIPAAWEDQPQRASASERFRRSLLGLTAMAGVGLATVVAPYLTAVVLAVLVVLLRGMSLTGARASDRRGLRGTRWYDVVLTPLTAPWFLLASLPGTFLLLVWAGALAGSGALVLVALGIGLGWGLFSLGALTALVLWTGPGASRLRSPVRRLSHPLARSGRSWAVTTACLLALIAGGAFLLDDRGTDWSPYQGAPDVAGSRLAPFL